MEVVEICVEPDDESHRRLKNRCMANDGVLLAKVKEFLVEEICEKYLDTIEEESSGGTRTTVEIVDADNAGLCEDFTDAQYKFFLDNLREDGSSFVVKYSVSDRVPLYVTYEEDDGTHESRPSNLVENRKSRAVSNKKSRGTSTAPKRSRSESVGEDHMLKERRSEALRTSRTVPVVRAGDAEQIEIDARRGKKTSVVKKNAGLKAKSCGSYHRKSSSHRQQNPEVLSFEDRKSTIEKNKLMEDDCYKAYLMWMEHRNENPETIPEKVLQVKREMGTESLCGSDIIAIADHPFSDEEDTPFVPARNYNAVDIDGKDDGAVGVSNSWFRKELMNVLRKPYNRKEFFNLYCDVSIRKNITRGRELRDGREICYETDIPGYSYLDKHPDFRDLFIPWVGSEDFKDLSKLPIKDRHRALNLLRGFFFYLKNVVHDGAFKPWLDTECLKTLPSTPDSLELDRTRCQT